MVVTGLGRLLRGDAPVLRGKRFGLCVNLTSVDARLRFSVDLLGDFAGAELCCLFGPEHGVRGDAQDMIGVGEAKDSVTGLPMYSLYGAEEASLWPKPEWLAGLDAIVFDMQDVGSRYYTYIWTLLHLMQVAAPLGVEVIVLDRPNPIGGLEVEGGAILPAYRSFVGRVSLPNRHGMTTGEIARMVNETEKIGAKLTVVEMEGWRRDMLWADTGLPWVMTSPNMPSVDTALVYPGMCLVEGTELSEGRGTTRPFELVGAGYISYAEARQIANALEKQGLPGVIFRPVVFTPTFHKYGGKRCGGLQVHVIDARRFKPYLSAIAVLRELRTRYPKDMHWRSKPYEFVADKPAIDLLCGGPEIRTGIDAGASLQELRATWQAGEDELREARKRWLLYT
jgi:uncharacterized protein YbbC (DUF1343 family)